MENKTKPNPWSKAVLVVLVFTFGHLFLALYLAIHFHYHEFLIYLAATPFFLLLVSSVHHRISFSVGLLWGLSFLILLHMAGGLLPVPPGGFSEDRNRLYDWWIIRDRLKFDHVVHTYGNAIATWFCWQLLQRTVASKTGWGFRELKPVPELLIFCVLAGMGIGSINEILEFITSQFISDSGVGGYRNTLMDLVSNTIGSFSVAFIIWAHGKKHCDGSNKLVCKTD